MLGSSSDRNHKKTLIHLLNRNLCFFVQLKMDPISIVGCIFAISTAVKNVVAGVDWITSLRNAPLEIFDLLNEVRLFPTT